MLNNNLNNNMNNNLNNKPGCCANVHGKSFELILIVLFTLGAIIIAANFILTRWYFKQSYILFFIEIGLIALNGLCLLFTIILRCWRSNGSVLNTNYSSSNCLSIFIIILIIINLLFSICEIILFYLVYYYIIALIDFFVLDKYVDWEKFNMEIFDKIMDNQERRRALSVNDDKDRFKTKLYTLKILPWISFSLNILIQILGIIFIILIRKRIKIKSDYGFPSSHSSTIKDDARSELSNAESAKIEINRKKRRRKRKKKKKYTN